MKVIAFGATTSSDSINKKLAAYAGSLIEGGTLEVVDLNDYTLPLYSTDLEKQLGQPDAALALLSKIRDADTVIISFAEHNGNFTAAYKNVFDWMSRATSKVFENKALLVLGTSPGARGAQTVIELALASLPRFGAEIKGSFSLPSFHDNFDVTTNCISNAELDAALKRVVNHLVSA